MDSDRNLCLDAYFKNFSSPGTLNFVNKYIFEKIRFSAIFYCLSYPSLEGNKGNGTLLNDSHRIKSQNFLISKDYGKDSRRTRDGPDESSR